MALKGSQTVVIIPIYPMGAMVDPGWSIGAIDPLKTYENNFIHHNSVKF